VHSNILAEKKENLRVFPKHAKYTNKPSRMQFIAWGNSKKDSKR
jgi:hypothetical protein